MLQRYKTVTGTWTCCFSSMVCVECRGWSLFTMSGRRYYGLCLPLLSSTS